jgi:hypothetical protein
MVRFCKQCSVQSNFSCIWDETKDCKTSLLLWMPVGRMSDGLLLLAFILCSKRGQRLHCIVPEGLEQIERMLEIGID